MFLFKKFHVQGVLDGTKTQTRRKITLFRKGPKLGQEVPPKKVGSIQQCRISRFGKPFAHIKILRRWKERIKDISKEDAMAEGGYSQEEYINGLCDMHKGALTPDSFVWCYEFELMKCKHCRKFIRPSWISDKTLGICQEDMFGENQASDKNESACEHFESKEEG